MTYFFIGCRNGNRNACRYYVGQAYNVQLLYIQSTYVDNYEIYLPTLKSCVFSFRFRS